MMFTVDRIEGEYAVLELENKETIIVPLKLIPLAKEGSVFELIERVDEEKVRRERITKLFDDLKK